MDKRRHTVRGRGGTPLTGPVIVGGRYLSLEDDGTARLSERHVQELRSRGFILEDVDENPLPTNTQLSIESNERAAKIIANTILQGLKREFYLGRR